MEIVNSSQLFLCLTIAPSNKEYVQIGVAERICSAVDRVFRVRIPDYKDRGVTPRLPSLLGAEGVFLPTYAQFC